MKRWAVLFGVLIVSIIVLADTRNLGFLHVINDIPFGDKAAHFLLYGVLSLLINLSVLESRNISELRWPTVMCSLILAILIGLEEYSQQWFPSRTSSLFDLAASYLGVGTFAWLAGRIKRSRSLPR